jgi:hypothetical protein
MSCVELMKRLQVHSTFIVKGNDKYYPMAALHSVLTARHGARPAGHWVTMKATISNINIIAVAYAWSQKGVSYFVSTCGSTEPSPIKYQSKFEDEWGNTNSRDIDRPKLAHFLYEYAPLIDEHNKQRQSLLALERIWKTKDPWFRLLTTLLGMTTVDMHRIYRYHLLNVKRLPFREVDDLGIVKFTDLLCGDLRQWQYSYSRKAAPTSGDTTIVLLTRITDKDGNTVRQPTEKQVTKGKAVGNPIVLMCYVCRRYLNNGIPKQRQTSWWCAVCHMPLCKTPRNVEGSGRQLTCLDEHLQSDDPYLGCKGNHIKGTAVPEHLHVASNRKSKRKRHG